MAFLNALFSFVNFAASLWSSVFSSSPSSMVSFDSSSVDLSAAFGANIVRRACLGQVVPNVRNPTIIQRKITILMKKFITGAGMFVSRLNWRS